MNLSTGVALALQLKRCEVPLELQQNFAGLRQVPLFFAGHVKKLNKRFKLQDRVVVATLDHLYVCDPNGDILRCFPYSRVETVIVDPGRQQMALVVPSEYDVAFSTADPHRLLHVIEVIRGLHHCATPLRVETVVASRNDNDDDEDDGGDGAKSKDSNGHGSWWSRCFRFASGSNEWFTGSATSNCIGRGYYKLRLERPEAFKLKLDNVNT